MDLEALGFWCSQLPEGDKFVYRFERTSWAGVFVPAKTPAAIVARLHKLGVDAVASDAMRAQSQVPHSQAPKGRPPRNLATVSANACGSWSGKGTMPPWISASRLPAISRTTRAVAG